MRAMQRKAKLPPSARSESHARAGLANHVIQTVKRTVARGLGWFVRDQVVFNQSVVTCVETLMESVNELNRSMVSLGTQIGERLDQGRQSSGRFRSRDRNARSSNYG